MEIVEITEYTDTMLEAINALMPQLSEGFGPLSRTDLEEILRSNTTRLYMAVDQHNYVGALTLVVFRIPSGLRAWIEDVVVSERARGRGIGQRLVEHAIFTATQADVKSIDLTARSSRAPAIALYKKLGFVDRETTVFRYSDS